MALDRQAQHAHCQYRTAGGRTQSQSNPFPRVRTRSPPSASTRARSRARLLPVCQHSCRPGWGRSLLLAAGALWAFGALGGGPTLQQGFAAREQHAARVVHGQASSPRVPGNGRSLCSSGADCSAEWPSGWGTLLGCMHAAHLGLPGLDLLRAWWATDPGRPV